MPSVLIAEDHPLFRDAVRSVLAQIFSSRGEVMQTMEAATIAELTGALDQGDEFDLILLDLFIPGAQGLSHLVSTRARMPSTPIVIFSSVTDPKVVRQTMMCGAAGYVPKSAGREEIAEAVGVVLGGGVYLPARFRADLDAAALRPRGRAELGDDPERGPLTGRQVAVLELVAAGKANKQIAWELGISEITVKTHVTAILRKLHVTNRAQAIVMFQRHLNEEAV